MQKISPSAKRSGRPASKTTGRPGGKPNFRAAAERALQSREMPEKDVLIHELRVHKIELEMQNDELRKAQAEIEESRSRYAKLYDFAPVG